MPAPPPTAETPPEMFALMIRALDAGRFAEATAIQKQLLAAGWLCSRRPTPNPERALERRSEPRRPEMFPR